MYRRALYTHAPGTLTYEVQIPDGARLDVGLRVVRSDASVTFRVTATPRGKAPETRLEESISDAWRWALRSVDLSDLAGQTVSLALESDAERAGSVALWAAPHDAEPGTFGGGGSRVRARLQQLELDAPLDGVVPHLPAAQRLDWWAPAGRRFSWEPAHGNPDRSS